MRCGSLISGKTAKNPKDHKSNIGPGIAVVAVTAQTASGARSHTDYRFRTLPLPKMQVKQCQGLPWRSAMAPESIVRRHLRINLGGRVIGIKIRRDFRF